MNIFVLDYNPERAAQQHCNKHVVKMILETAQLMCIAHVQTGGEAPYKGQGFRNHPCAKWARASTKNYKWLCKLGLALCKEYTYRYNKVHKTQAVIKWCEKNIPNIPDGPLTYFPQAMPDDCKGIDTVKAYHKYYNKYKFSFAKWTKRDRPDWYSPE